MPHGDAAGTSPCQIPEILQHISMLDAVKYQLARLCCPVEKPLTG
jgi:hypothetical protein